MSIDTNNVSENPGTPESSTSADTSQLTKGSVSPTKPSAPKPGVPKPGTGAIKKPIISAAAPVQSTEDLKIYGYIDDDGNVWKKSPTGEDTVIAQWLAGSEQEGLEHFHHKYREISGEVSILNERLTKGADPQSVHQSALKIQASIPHTPMLGDISKLDGIISDLVSLSAEKSVEAEQQRSEQIAYALRRKEEIAQEAEGLSTSEEWKATGQQFAQLTAQWDELNAITRKDDNSSWKKFIKAKEAFNRNRGAYFSALDKRKAEAKNSKQELVNQAQAIVTPYTEISLDEPFDVDTHGHLPWSKTSQELKALLGEWKKIGKTDKNFDEKLWADFKEINDQFFARRNKLKESENQLSEQIAQQVQEKIDQYSQNIQEQELPQARSAFQKMVQEITSLSDTHLDRKHAVFNQVRDLEKDLKTRQNKNWENDNPELRARAEQFASKAAKLEQQAQKAEHAGDAKKAQQLYEDAAQWREWAQSAI